MSVLSGLRVTHRRGGYRDPESQAFIESWFSKLKERLIWRTEFETLEQAREEVYAYITSYHDRLHSGLNYRTPPEIRPAWEEPHFLSVQAPARSLPVSGPTVWADGHARSWRPAGAARRRHRAPLVVRWERLLGATQDASLRPTSRSVFPRNAVTPPPTFTAGPRPASELILTRSLGHRQAPAGESRAKAAGPGY